MRSPTWGRRAPHVIDIIDLKIEPGSQSNATTTQIQMGFLRRMMMANMPTTKLGRWQLHYDPNIVNSKVDQANEDHCGCCHASTHQRENNQTMKKEQMLHQKKKWQEKQQRIHIQKHLQKYSESEEYYIPYVM